MNPFRTGNSSTSRPTASQYTNLPSDLTIFISNATYAHPKFCILLLQNQPKMASSHSSCHQTNFQTPTTLEFLHNVPSVLSASTVDPPLSPRCTSANQVSFHTVGLPNKQFSPGRTPNVSLILLKAQSPKQNWQGETFCKKSFV